MKVHDNIVVSMSISSPHAVASGSSHNITAQSSHDGPLHPSTSEILRICPR